jgi:hypothetical protein
MWWALWNIVTASADGEETACQDNQETSGGAAAVIPAAGTAMAPLKIMHADINPGDDELVCGDDYEMKSAPTAKHRDGRAPPTMKSVTSSRGRSGIKIPMKKKSVRRSVELDDDNDCYMTVKDVCDETDISLKTK